MAVSSAERVTVVILSGLTANSTATLRGPGISSAGMSRQPDKPITRLIRKNAERIFFIVRKKGFRPEERNPVQQPIKRPDRRSGLRAFPNPQPLWIPRSPVPQGPRYWPSRGSIRCGECRLRIFPSARPSTRLPNGRP